MTIRFMLEPQEITRTVVITDTVGNRVRYVVVDDGRLASGVAADIAALDDATILVRFFSGKFVSFNA